MGEQKVHLREAQKDRSSLPTAVQIYPQANLTQFGGVGTNMPSTYDHQPPTLTDASFFWQVPLYRQQNSPIW